ncbi:MAG TPA: serine/threonine protein kinase, partial [Isosphaeraceae bacterium]|nr:serine/threonine protein kinase [Isosphaeraceae bacterium]
GAALAIALTTGVAFAVVAERERRSRAEHLIEEVAALYRKADWFRDQARRIPPDQLDTWERALAHVRRTAEIVGAGAIDKVTRVSVDRLINELRDEEKRIRERVREQLNRKPE